MDDQTRQLNPQARKRIDEYLDAVDRALREAGKDRAERRNITDDVEAQILDMLAARAGDSPTDADVEALLTDLDPPEAYAAEATTEPSAPVAPGETRFSRTAIVGAVWAGVFFIVAWMSMITVTVHTVPGEEPPGPAWWQTLLAFTLLPLGLAGPFGTTILGIVSISQIRRSAGRLYGLGLALFDALLFPLLALDVGIYWFWTLVAEAVRKTDLLGRGATANETVVLIVTILTCVIVDVLIVRAAWQAVKPPTRDETGVEESPEAIRKRARMGALALAIGLGGLVVAVLIGVVGGLFNRDATMPAYALFLCCQVAAIVLGALAFRDPMGKAASIIGSVLALGSILVLA